jgi:aspartyl/asparaginyl beta-hydroxylase (cupin superfamily)/Tfp pilus assembly protein PilF
MQNTQNKAQEIALLESHAIRAAEAGRMDEALQYWTRVLALDPNHVRTLSALGQQALRRNDLNAARMAFQRVVDIDGSVPQEWVNLALACRALKDEQGEEAAIQRALTLDPMELVSLILRADLLERQGKLHEAVGVYSAVTTVAPPMDRLHPELRASVARAFAYRQKYDNACAAFMDAYLDPHYQTFAGEKLGRFRDSFDIVVGRKKRFDSMSTQYHYPLLLTVEFLERADFPWLDAIEAGTDAIRDEFLAILDAEEGFTPYISYAGDKPVNQFAELNNSPRWSAFHLHKDGKLVEENAAKCPRTMELLAGAPQPDQPGRTPSSMFSLLKPKTRIPPHGGVSNCRLVTHLPLIIPEDCGFRVGNQTREWVPGQAWVFDDTINHEAWNMSDKLRVILIFDIWHPHLSVAERAMITAMTAGMNAFVAETLSLEA